MWRARSSSCILMRGTLQKGFHGVVKDAFYHPSRTCGRPKKRNLSVPFVSSSRKVLFIYFKYFLFLRIKYDSPNIILYGNNSISASSPRRNLCIGGLPPNLNSPSTCREALAASPLIVGQAAFAAQVFSDQSFPVLKIIHPVAGDTAARAAPQPWRVHVFTRSA